MGTTTSGAQNREQQPAASSSADENQSESSNSSSESVYFQASWPSEVDPATASAYLKNDSLTLTVKRAAAPKSTAE